MSTHEVDSFSRIVPTPENGADILLLKLELNPNKRLYIEKVKEKSFTSLNFNNLFGFTTKAYDSSEDSLSFQTYWLITCIHAQLSNRRRKTFSVKQLMNLYIGYCSALKEKALSQNHATKAYTEYIANKLGRDKTILAFFQVLGVKKESTKTRLGLKA